MIVDWEQYLNKTTIEVKKLLNLSEPPQFWLFFRRLYETS